MAQGKERIFLGLLLTVLVLCLWGIAWPFVSALILASILAVAMHPTNIRLRRHMQAGPASCLTTFATALVLGTTIAFICVTAIKTTRNAYQELSQRSHGQGDGSGMMVSTINRIVDAVGSRLPIPRETIKTKVLAGMEVGGRYIISGIQNAIASITSILVTSVLAIIFLYHLLRHGEEWLRQAVGLVPLNPDTTANLLRAAHQSIVANVNGVLAVALAQGLFLSLGFWFVDVRSPLQWGVFGAIASVIPFVGVTLVWVPAVIGFVVMGSYWKALVFGLWGGLVVGSLDNILRPLVVGARDKQNPVLLGFAMLGGTYAIGPLGLLVGPLVISLTGTVIEECQRMSAVVAAASTRATNRVPGASSEHVLG